MCGTSPERAGASRSTPSCPQPLVSFPRKTAISRIQTSEKTSTLTRLILILRIDKIIEKHSHLDFFVGNLCVFEQKLGPSHQVFTWFNFNNDWFNFIISHWQCLVENPIEFLRSDRFSRRRLTDFAVELRVRICKGWGNLSTSSDCSLKKHL